jgi:2-polyprenyl-3-methyl-5-hydroxy-6-metoxy-1,4-benzoquinol methylase
MQIQPSPIRVANQAVSAAQAAAMNHRYWASCNDTHVAAGPYYRRVTGMLPVLCERYLTPQDTVLDVGCGNGEYTQYIAACCDEVRAFDLSPALLDQARRRGTPNIDYRSGDLASLLDHRDTLFDAVFVMGVFVTIHGDRFEQAAADLAQLVRPGGLLITRDSVTAEEDIVRHVTDGYVAHYRSADHFIGGLSDAGFTLERSIFIDAFGDLTNSFYVFRKN